MKRAALAGALLGFLPLPVCYLMAGGGHGTAWPLFLFYGPACAVAFAGVVLPSMVSLVVLCVAIVGLYAVYGAILSRARDRGYGSTALVPLLAFHYLCAVVFIVCGEPDTHYVVDVVGFYPTVAGLGWALFVGLHLVALLYVRNHFQRPFQFTLRDVAGLMLICALGCSGYAAMRSWTRQPRSPPTSEWPETATDDGAEIEKE